MNISNSDILNLLSDLRQAAVVRSSSKSLQDRNERLKPFEWSYSGHIEWKTRMRLITACPREHIIEMVFDKDPTEAVRGWVMQTSSIDHTKAHCEAQVKMVITDDASSIWKTFRVSVLDILSNTSCIHVHRKYEVNGDYSQTPFTAEKDFWQTAL